MSSLLMAHPDFDEAAAPLVRSAVPLSYSVQNFRFRPAEPFAGLKIPRLTSAGDLAAWLDLTLDELDWLSDTRRQQTRTATTETQHYRYSLTPKSDGTPRLIESPKPKLRNVQKRILREILDLVPASPCAHGFVRGRSAATAASLHSGEAVVINLDL
ncbi:MAG: RNA-directed DNA polymerase, partial [Pseudomonadota bacterium]